VRIDVGTAGDEAAGTGAGATGHERRNGGRPQGGDAGPADTDQTTLDRTIELPNGALVDVLA
jgi:hypothetical protein